MTTKPKRGKAAAAKPGTLSLKADPDKSWPRQLADVALNPTAHTAAIATLYNQGTFGAQDSTELFKSLLDSGKALKANDLTRYKAMLAMQAESLNAVFTELSRRAALNMGEYLGATETYLRLAMKAQAQCRANIEALDRLSSGRVQTVRHVHVNQGGQAVIADEFHHHTGGDENGKSGEQPHATGTAGESAALSGPDPIGQAVPVASGEGKEAVPHARRQRQRRAEGQP